MELDPVHGSPLPADTMLTFVIQTSGETMEEKADSLPYSRVLSQGAPAENMASRVASSCGQAALAAGGFLSSASLNIPPQTASMRHLSEHSLPLVPSHMASQKMLT